MLDVAQSVKKLKHVQQVVYAESDGELREIWVRMLKGSHEFAKMALSINKDIVLTHHGAPVEGLSYRSSARFFIDPGPSITKAGLCQSMAASIDAKLMHPNCCYMLTNQVTENIIGRFFQIVERCSYARLSAYLQEQGLVKANIAKRNFVLDVEAIRKKTKLKEGGDTYLFFTSEYPSQKPVVYICKKR